jgi:hypothetical protein
MVHEFDILDNISDYLTLVVPTGANGGVQHAITTIGQLYIFDSTNRQDMHLFKESLDWCCNTPLGFKGVFFAIRFPMKEGRLPKTKRWI